MSENEKTTKAIDMDIDMDKDAKYEAVVAELKVAQDTIKQYEAAYKDLQFKFNRLYGVLNAQIDCTLNIK